MNSKSNFYETLRTLHTHVREVGFEEVRHHLLINAGTIRANTYAYTPAAPTLSKDGNAVCVANPPPGEHDWAIALEPDALVAYRAIQDDAAGEVRFLPCGVLPIDRSLREFDLECVLESGQRLAYQYEEVGVGL